MVTFNGNLIVRMKSDPEVIQVQGGDTIYLWGGYFPRHEIEAIKFDGSDWETNISKLVENANGVFFCMIHLAKLKYTVFFSDPFACRKIFMREDEGKITLAQDLIDFKGSAGNPKNLNRRALAQYLLYGYIASNQTLYTGIESLEPFTWYVWDGLKLERNRVDLPAFDECPMSYEKAVARTAKVLDERFRELTEGSTDLCIPLSGGRDSRYLLALALKHFPKKMIHTFTFGRPGSMDYEIGRGLARKHGLRHYLMAFHEKDYLKRVIEPATIDKHGLVNHAQESPSRFFEGNPLIQAGTRVISGFIGDAVLAWHHEREMVNYKGRLWPRTSIFSYEQVIELAFPDIADQIIKDIDLITCQLRDFRGNLERELWLYRVHATFFTAPCMFSESRSIDAVLPFVDREFLRHLFQIPREYKLRQDFYHDVLGHDPEVYHLFQYPMKTMRGKGYGINPVRGRFQRFSFYLRAMIKGARPMKNYVDFRRAIPVKRLKEIKERMESTGLLDRLMWNGLLSRKQQVLLYSLYLNLNCFFFNKAA